MMRVRELPPLRHSIEVETPNRRYYRWATDEPDARNIPSGITHSSTMPGGYEQSDCVLSRKPGEDYPDLQRLSTVRVRDAAGQIVSETRLERTPRTSGDRMSISPGSVGYQAHLDDDKSAREIYRDADLSRWRGSSAQRRIDLIATGYGPVDANVEQDQAGTPHLKTGLVQPWQSTAQPVAEAFYDAGKIPLGSLYYAWKRGTHVVNTDANWSWSAQLGDSDRLLAGTFDNTGSLRAAGPGSGTLAATTATRYAASVRLDYAAVTVAADPNRNHDLYWTSLAVYGTHGITKRGTEPAAGFYASDIVAHVIRTWAPLLSFTEGDDGTIQPSTFIIPHSTFLDPTTAGAMIRDAIRYGLQDWAVWDGPTFYMNERGARGRSWRARVGPAELEETGPQVERLWNSVIVQYRDVDGTTRTVGPTGSGADTISADLEDTDPQNPANQLGITRRQLLQMGTGTAGSATEIGRRFLEQSKLLDSSGRARLVGHVEDDRGILHPYSHVRAGDTITFVDAADPTPRRIVRAQHEHDTRSCSVDLDAPPEGLDALLERLAVALVPLGL